MNASDLSGIAKNKSNFVSLADYINFCAEFLEFIETGLQAVIVSQNAPNYRFFQYREDGFFNISRPLNAELMLTANENAPLQKEFLPVIKNAKDVLPDDSASRALIRRAIYTIQQSTGAALDALPAGQANNARKINGDMFERLIVLLIRESGLDCRGGTVRVPVMVDGKEAFKMKYQQDLLIYREQQLKIIGSVKTSSKDRLGKIFVDKFLYNSLTETNTPHIAVFLNDVQRKKTSTENIYGINSTFLTNHFKGFTVKLNPLEGVYYCDLLPLMRTDAFFKTRIKTIDRFFCDDLQEFIKK